MKARPPKEYHELSKAGQKRIEDYIIECATEAARKQEEKDCRIILDLYIKMICCLFHDSEGYGKKRLTRVLYNHKRMFSFQNRLVTKGDQLEYLNKRMDEIFGKGGFPNEVIDSILGEVEIIDAPEGEGK